MQKTKVCPECGQELFADMDVCYGCMHEFARAAALRVVSRGLECTVSVPEEGLVVGRCGTCDVVLHERQVSRQHVRITPEDGGLLVQDLGSTNAPVVRGRPVHGSAHLGPGDELVVCDVTFTPV